MTKRKTAKAKAVDLMAPFAQVLEVLAPLRNDRERAQVLAASFPLLDRAALRYLQSRLIAAMDRVPR
jgi:hypothetical protein